MGKIVDYIKLYGVMVYLNLKARAVYRANFVMSLVQSSLTTTVFISTIWILLERFSDIKGWNIYEIGFILGLAKITIAINAMMFSSMWVMDSLINFGEIDRLLLKPKSTVFLLICQRFDIMWVGELISSISILVYTGIKSEAEWTVLNILYLILVIICAVAIYSSIIFMTGLLAFWFLKSGSIREFISLMYNNFSTYPIEVYGKKIQFVLTFILPFGFIYYYPLLYFFNKSDPIFPEWMAFCTPVAALVVVGLAYIMWILGLRAYKSAGS